MKKLDLSQMEAQAAEQQKKAEAEMLEHLKQKIGRAHV